jgi:hypothetical protein
MSLVLDLRIDHDRFGSSSDPSLNGNLHYPHNIDRSLIETVDDRMFRPIRVDHTNCLQVDIKTHHLNITLTTTIPLHIVWNLCLLLLVRLGGYIVNLSDFYSYLKNRVDLTLTKQTVLHITFNLDGTPITSKSQTHPSHSQTSRLLTSSLS